MMKYMSIFFISMLPFIELRGSVFYAQVLNLDIYTALLVAIIGNMIPVPFIFLFERKLLEYGSKKKYTAKLFSYMLQKGHDAGEKLKNKSKNGLYIALLLFVGIPFPGTGAWTGALAASILDMDFKKSMIFIILGITLAGVIMSVISVIGFRFI